MRFHAGAIDFSRIAGEMPEQAFCYLAAATVAGAKYQDFFIWIKLI